MALKEPSSHKIALDFESNNEILLLCLESVQVQCLALYPYIQSQAVTFYSLKSLLLLTPLGSQSSLGSGPSGNNLRNFLVMLFGILTFCYELPTDLILSSYA